MSKKNAPPASVATDAGERDYAIGYGKPPKGRPFPKGRSGNTKGRPRGAPNLATVLRKVLTEELSVTQGARQLKMTAFEAMIRKHRQAALNGNVKSLTTLLTLMREYCPELLAQEVKATLAADDQMLIAEFYNRTNGLGEGFEAMEQTRPGADEPRAGATP